jgi:hypothetical protein
LPAAGSDPRSRGAAPPGEIGLICARTGYPDFTYANNDSARAIERDGLALGDMGYWTGGSLRLRSDVPAISGG